MRVICEFAGAMIRVRLGRLRLSDGMLHADARYGVAHICASDDGTARVAWYVRHAQTSTPAADAPEDEWVVAPGEAELVLLDGCPSGVAYALKFSGTRVSEYFWLQEPRAHEYGASFVAEVNRVLQGQRDAGGKQTHEDAQRAVRRSARLAETRSEAGAPGTPTKQRRVRRVRFAEVLSADALRDALSDARVVEAAGAHLPPGRPRTAGEVLETVRSPQFQQNRFDSATTGLTIRAASGSISASSVSRSRIADRRMALRSPAKPAVLVSALAVRTARSTAA